jgi:SAM-dependent methyltransferase
MAVVDMEQTYQRRDALMARLFQATLGFFDIYAIYLGNTLGLYRVLLQLGPMTAADLATRASADPRYVREWLEQQAASGVLDVAEPDAGDERRRYLLPAAHVEVLLDGDSLNCMAGLVRLAVGSARPLSAVMHAFRTGDGVAFADYGADVRDGIAEMNRAMYLNLLGSVWLPAVPTLHARLLAEPAARVADVGCGTGWSSIALARAYPSVEVDGFDLDASSIAAATSNARAVGLGDRVRFQVADAAGGDSFDKRYDLVMAFEMVHDLARPVEALRAMRALLHPDGVVLVADERVGDAFAAPADELDRFNYGWSILHCLPASRAESPSAATGTVMRTATLRNYAAQAGFSRADVLPIENDFWRFYRLVP